MRILFIGDIVGGSGRNAVKSLMGELRAEYQFDFCIANGENMAGGSGFTAKCLHDLDGSGVDVFTGGDHTWDQKEFQDEINGFPKVLRPANVSALQPGRGYGIFDAGNGVKVGVINLLGRTFMGGMSNCPFESANGIVDEMRRTTPVIIVDFHGEATSDKIALGRFLDGRVTAVLGTHTHVPTADEQIFPGGTAFQCDVGMVGSRESILGRDMGFIIQRYRTGMPVRFPVAERAVRLNCTVVTLDESTGKATGIERVVKDMP